MAEAWQIPVTRPWALGDANMISVSVRQTLPAPGVLDARRAARDAEARVAEAGGRERALAVAREAGHAFVDLQSAEAKRVSHLAHRDVATRLVTIARARLGTAAGRLTDVTQADVERARLEADVAVESAMVTRATARLNGLLRRPIDAAITPVPLGAPETLATPFDQVVAVAEASRPELAGTRARRAAEEATSDAATREAKVPAFTVGAGWFAPTTLMPFHGYGVSASATLPWVWGGARARAEASRAQARAAGFELSDRRAQLRTEIGAALADVQVAALRVSVLSARAKPAADAALEAALSAYQSGQAEAMALFRSEKDVVEIDVALADARTMLAHALVDVDAAAGARLPRVRLDARSVTEDAAHDHAAASPPTRTP
jgi:outer membrane protein TolC